MMEKNKCPICQGMGFNNGKICPCVTGYGVDGMPDIFKDIFRGLWGGTPDSSATKGEKGDKSSG